MKNTLTKEMIDHLNSIREEMDKDNPTDSVEDMLRKWDELIRQDKIKKRNERLDKILKNPIEQEKMEKLYIFFLIYI